MDDNRPSSDKLNLKQHVEDFSGHSTLHGLHFVIGANRGMIRRAIWLVIVLSGFGILAFQLYQSCSSLLRYEHVITREIIRNKSQVFPAVTICNHNMMKRSKIEGTDAEIYLDKLNTLSNMISPLHLNKAINASFDLLEATYKYGHTAKDMIGVCVWDGKFCSPDNFMTRVSHRYGLCHTFNSGRQGHPLLYSSSIKRGRGLHLFLDADTTDYYGINSYFSTGIRLVIHDQNEEPMVETNGIDISVGDMTTLRIRRNEYHSLRPQYKSACGSTPLQTSKVYTQNRCILECSTLHAVLKCGCKVLGMPDLKELKGMKYCSPEDFTTCVLNNSTLKLQRIEEVNVPQVLSRSFIDNDSPFSSDNPQEECDMCPNDCNRVTYTTTQLSAVPFVSELFWDDYIQILFRLVESNVTRELIKKDIDKFKVMVKKQFLYLIVHYDDLRTYKTSEKEAYTIVQLGADVGGYLGLFLGCSVITILEFVDFLICYLAARRSSVLEVNSST